jgi:hypothetical protein
MSNTTTTSLNACRKTSDRACRARAYVYLVELIGAHPDALTWDATHCLQGRVRLACCELVVIAPRDAFHEPVVLTTPSWDAIRRSFGDQRRELIESCSITDHEGLQSALASDALASSGALAA